MTIEELKETRDTFAVWGYETLLSDELIEKIISILDSEIARQSVTSSDMAKVKLLFTQTRYDQLNMWTECREVEVDLPEWVTEKLDTFEWHVTGMIKQED